MKTREIRFISPHGCDAEVTLKYATFRGNEMAILSVRPDLVETLGGESEKYNVGYAQELRRIYIQPSKVGAIKASKSRNGKITLRFRSELVPFEMSPGDYSLLNDEECGIHYFVAK